MWTPRKVTLAMYLFRSCGLCAYRNRDPIRETDHHLSLSGPWLLSFSGLVSETLPALGREARRGFIAPAVSASHLLPSFGRRELGRELCRKRFCRLPLLSNKLTSRLPCDYFILAISPLYHAFHCLQALPHRDTLFASICQPEPPKRLLTASYTRR